MDAWEGQAGAVRVGGRVVVRAAPRGPKAPVLLWAPSACCQRRVQGLHLHNEAPIGRACVMCGQLLRRNPKRREASRSTRRRKLQQVRQGASSTNTNTTSNSHKNDRMDESDRTTPLTSNVSSALASKAGSVMDQHYHKPKKVPKPKVSQRPEPPNASKTKKTRRTLEGTHGETSSRVFKKGLTKKVHWEADKDKRNSNAENDDLV